jgi:hypothetical protein
LRLPQKKTVVRNLWVAGIATIVTHKRPNMGQHDRRFCFRDSIQGTHSMEGSALRRSVPFVVLVANIALTGQSTFGGTTECRASPGPPAAQGMHWYYRVDRTSNRHCWYLQPAGMQVRSHEIAPLSKPVPAQIVPEQSLAASEKVDLQTLPLQAAAAEDVRIEPSEPSIGAPSAAHFNARWSHAPASVDFGYDFASSRRGTAAEQASPRPEEVMLSTRVSPDTVSPSLHKSRNPVKLGLLFIAGAISAILFATLLKLARVLCSFRTRPRLKSELDDGSEISLSELMRALRRVDQSLKAAEAQRYPAPKHVSSSQTREQQNEIIIIGPQLPPFRA